MNRSTAIPLLFCLLGLTACVSPPTPIAFEGLGKTKYLRCTLRPVENYIYSSNYLGVTGRIPAGCTAEVTMFSTQRVDMSLNKISYQMHPMTVFFNQSPKDFLEKYLVDTKEELGLEKMDAPTRDNIQSGQPVIGMTKEQAYAALGPPNWVDFDVDATNLTRAAVLDRNRWEYRESTIMFWPIKKVFIFLDGKLQSTIP